MSWVRLYITVEGQTEKQFADTVLKPHLANYRIDARPRVVVTNRKLGKRGGILDYAKIKGDVTRLMREDADTACRFTTMVDLYALPPQFPGWSEAEKKAMPVERVRALEKAMLEEIGSSRFLPFIQLHEFEALLYCDLDELEKRIVGSSSGIAALRKDVAEMAPEDIDEGDTTAPSKRIIRHVPIYARNKVRVGAPAAAAIGLANLRAKCPHFSEWIGKLEQFGIPL
jgi:hypothetical protein